MFRLNFPGPAHKKSFTVCLKLGDSEKYIASGPSIKKAQHAAAAIALEKTSLKHPPPKAKATKNGLYFSAFSICIFKLGYDYKLQYVLFFINYLEYHYNFQLLLHQLLS